MFSGRRKRTIKRGLATGEMRILRTIVSLEARLDFIDKH
jgi:hypothetical protein